MQSQSILYLSICINHTNTLLSPHTPFSFSPAIVHFNHWTLQSMIQYFCGWSSSWLLPKNYVFFHLHSFRDQPYFFQLYPPWPLLKSFYISLIFIQYPSLCWNIHPYVIPSYSTIISSYLPTNFLICITEPTTSTKGSIFPPPPPYLPWICWYILKTPTLSPRW